MFSGNQFWSTTVFVILFFNFMCVLFFFNWEDLLGPCVDARSLNRNSTKQNLERLNSKNFNSRSKSRYFLTIMTSFSHMPARNDIELNTVKNWAQLGTEVKCLDWYSKNTDTSTNLSDHKKDHGWMTKEFTHQKHNLPMVKYLFVDGASLVESEYFCFANGDILFTRNLLQTLHAVDKHHKVYHPEEGFLLIGRRTNVDFSVISNQTLNETSLAQIKELGTLHATNAIDYFITPARGFPWTDILEVVIARLGWDNYVISYAIDQHVITYDATNTVTAIHQTYTGKRSMGRSNKDAKMNYPLLKSKRRDMLKHLKHFGQTCNSSHTTEVDRNGNIVVQARVIKETKD